MRVVARTRFNQWRLYVTSRSTLSIPGLEFMGPPASFDYFRKRVDSRVQAAVRHELSQALDIRLLRTIID